MLRPVHLKNINKQQGIVVTQPRKKNQETPKYLHLDTRADFTILLRNQDQGRQPRPLR